MALVMRRSGVRFPKAAPKPFALTSRATKAPGDLVFTAPKGGVLRNTNFRPRFFDPAAENVAWAGFVDVAFASMGCSRMTTRWQAANR